MRMWREGNPHTVFQENFIYSFIAHAGSLSLQGLFSSQSEQGPLQLWGAGFSLQQFLFLLWSTGSIVVVHGLSCFMACGIFPDQGSNLSPAFASGFFTTEPPRKLQVHCWWDQKLVQPLWKVAQRLLKKLKMQIPYGPAILLLYLSDENKNISSKKYMPSPCSLPTPMFFATVFTIAKIWK